MGVLKIDYNRGVMKKVDQKTGIEVFMYLDMPGVYYNAFEKKVPEDTAKGADFDVAKYGKMKRQRELMAKAMNAINEQLGMEEYAEKPQVIEERNGFKIVHIGLGRHVIEDPEGGKIIERPLTLEEAKVALDKLVLPEPQPTKKAKA